MVIEGSMHAGIPSSLCINLKFPAFYDDDIIFSDETFSSYSFKDPQNKLIGTLSLIVQSVCCIFLFQI